MTFFTFLAQKWPKVDRGRHSRTLGSGNYGEMALSYFFFWIFQFKDECVVSDLELLTHLNTKNNIFVRLPCSLYI